MELSVFEVVHEQDDLEKIVLPKMKTIDWEWEKCYFSFNQLTGATIGDGAHELFGVDGNESVAADGEEISVLLDTDPSMVNELLSAKENVVVSKRKLRFLLYFS